MCVRLCVWLSVLGKGSIHLRVRPCVSLSSGYKNPSIYQENMIHLEVGPDVSSDIVRLQKFAIKITIEQSQVVMKTVLRRSLIDWDFALLSRPRKNRPCSFSWLETAPLDDLEQKCKSEAVQAICALERTSSVIRDSCGLLWYGLWILHNEISLASCRVFSLSCFAVKTMVKKKNSLALRSDLIKMNG